VTRSTAVFRPVRAGRAVVAALAILAASGRAATAQAPGLPVVGETIDVRVVNVEVMVTDRRDQPVKGLTASDFQLLVDGQEVAVDYFTEVRDGQATNAGTSPAAAPAPGAEVARNYLVFVDDGFAIGSCRDATLDSLRDGLDLLRPGDRMAVVAFDGAKLAVLSSWTADKATLAAALLLAKAHSPHGNLLLAQARSMDNDQDLVMSIPDDGDRSPLVPQMRDVNRLALAARVSPEGATQVHKSATAAVTSLRALEPQPGRRIMLLLSASWSLAAGPRFYAPLIAAANQLGYTLFPLDVANDDAASLQLFDALARPTGGRGLSGTERALVSQIVAETASYYSLGFTAAGAADARQHRIEVRPRPPGLTARSRRTYSDVSRESAAVMKAENVLLFGPAQAASPRNSGQELTVDAGAPRAAGRGKLEVPLTLALPLAALAFTQQGSSWVAEVPLVVAVLAEDGGRGDLPRSNLRLTLTAPPAAGDVARFRTTLELRRIRQRLVLAIPDAQSGEILTREIDIVPPT
jgi:VWFA-related protein